MEGSISQACEQTENPSIMVERLNDLTIHEVKILAHYLTEGNYNRQMG